MEAASFAITTENQAPEPLKIHKEHPNDKIIALAGNPNVGKSTVFNALTGMKQHTGNWPGKTVASAQGTTLYNGTNYILVDLPGTYSLMAHSAEEEIARDFICFGGADAAIVVCDATCLERNLNLVLQTIEITSHVIVCVNLMDEAKKKKIWIDFRKLQNRLGVPVISTEARSRKGFHQLLDQLEKTCSTAASPVTAIQTNYPGAVEDALQILAPVLSPHLEGKLNSRWLAIKLLENDNELISSFHQHLGKNILDLPDVAEARSQAQELLAAHGLSPETVSDCIVSALIMQAEAIAAECVTFEKKEYNLRDRRLDRCLTGRWTGIPIMLLLLAFIFYLTMTGANYPSALLSDALFWLQDRLTDFFHWAGAPEWLHGVLVLGVYRVLAWVVSVMLPPMAIFFPLFTLLEDLGYLPRVAFNLDHQFKKCGSCGKQALTLCMGFGCNAVGVTGARIIDSPRERLIAILTNNFVPCNGRFPTMIAIISMFFVSAAALPLQSMLSALLLTGVIVLGVFMTFAVSRLLSGTLLKGVPSSFALELPPYRRPQVGKVIVRSILDRTIFVLGRAAAIAAPAGLIIWIMANVTVGGSTLLAHCAGFFDPFARLLGMDGIILMAFILGFPANEIVVPIMIMAYMATGSILELESLEELKTLLVSNGWTWVTAVSTILFSLMHWPCSTTCLTIYKETKSFKWTALSFLIPTGIGMIVCFVFTSVMRLFGLV